MRACLMNQSLAVWLVVVAALVAANLPFISSRLLGVIVLQSGKTLFFRFVELAVLYFLVGGFGVYLEQQSGQVTSQGWQFYVITGTLFLTLAFPGFTYRYLFKRHN